MQQIGNRADVVLVPVGDKKTLDFVLVFLKVCEIRNYKVNAEHFVIGKSHSAIDYDYFVLVFIHGHIFSDFAQAAQRNYFKGRVLRRKGRSAAAALSAEGVFLFRIKMRFRLLFCGKLLLLRLALWRKLWLGAFLFRLLLLFLLRLFFGGFCLLFRAAFVLLLFFRRLFVGILCFRQA